MRLGRRQKQVSLDMFLVKVAQKEKESTDSSDSVTLSIFNLNNKNIKRYI
jgi:hypothetical protein